MNVLLIYPEFPDTSWSFKHALKFIRKPASSPPLGLLTVAAMLPADWSPRLVDLNVRSLTDSDLAWADCAFISAMAVQRLGHEVPTSSGRFPEQGDRVFQRHRPQVRSHVAALVNRKRQPLPWHARSRCHPAADARSRHRVSNNTR